MAPASQRPAIVTDGLWRKSVSAIRSLGRTGYGVTVLGDSLCTTGFYSRYARRRIRGKAAAEDPGAFGSALIHAIATSPGRPIILPMEDASCEWILKRGQALAADADWLLPSLDSFQIARDKGLTIQAAQRLGLDCPRTFFPESAEELARLIAALPAPELENLVVKPRTGTGSAGILYGRAIAAADLGEHWRKAGALLLQERVPASGDGLGISLLYDRAGRCRAAFAHRRLQQYPSSGGPSTQRISIPLDSGLLSQSRRLLESLGWRGAAMVEWKTHPATGRHLLMEINPRFWGSLELGIRAGVDFPRLYALAATGGELPEELPSYQAGVRCRWLVPGDILRYLSAPRGARESLASFLRGFWTESEEFDRHDWRGSLACWLCPLFLALNPRYWKYLRRGRSA